MVEVEGVKILARAVPGADAKSLRDAADTLRDRLKTGVVVLAGERDEKAMLLVAVTPDLKGRLHAGKLVGALAAHVDGRGGGRPDLEQAGGPNVAGGGTGPGVTECGNVILSQERRLSAVKSQHLAI